VNGIQTILRELRAIRQWDNQLPAAKFHLSKETKDKLVAEGFIQFTSTGRRTRYGVTGFWSLTEAGHVHLRQHDV
jgi:hypothetical protein